jgi:hypothetical protein
VFCGRHLLVAKLRRADLDAAVGAVEEVARLVARISVRCPRTRILLRADSGFARDDLLAWCEANGVDFLFGLAQNERLIAENERACLVAAKSRRTGRPERRFKTFMWMMRRTWSRKRRVVAKAECIRTPGAAVGRCRFRNDVDARGSQSALRRHLAQTRRAQRQTSLREGLLLPRRHGEPDQGAAAPVVLFDGLCPALCPAPDWPA